jgi:hypothetical protein
LTGASPLLGAAVNLCDRPARFKWTNGQDTYLRNDSELAEQVLVYGVFTVGAVADQGRTQLELDVAEPTN